MAPWHVVNAGQSRLGWLITTLAGSNPAGAHWPSVGGLKIIFKGVLYEDQNQKPERDRG